jgi:hypothetical protein
MSETTGKLLQMPRTSTTVLPQVWATDGSLARVVEPQETPAAEPVKADVIEPGVAFYRTYTEAMLRRYCVLQTESGRVPSMLGRSLFRGKVSNYRVHAFDDVVIFVHDVERCIRELSPRQQRLIHRIGVQQYTFAETARMLGVSLRTVQRNYWEAVDDLTMVFLRKRLMEGMPGFSCQGGERRG